MGAQASQIQTPQGNQPVNPPPTQANYSPVQQQYGGGKGFPTISPQQQLPVGATPDQNMEPQGKGQKVMYSPLSNQPKMGQPNPYPNTVGQWDNASIQPQTRRSGKGKGY